MAESAPETSSGTFTAEDSSSKTEQKEVKMEQKEIEMEQKEIEMEQKEIEMEQKEVKMEQTEIEMEQKEVKMEQTEVKMEQEEVKMEQKEIEMEQKEVKMEQKEVKMEQEEVKMEQEEVKVPDDELFLSALPDELLLYEDAGDSSRLDYNSQNATAAARGASSTPAQKASSGPRPPSELPETERPQILSVTSTMSLGCCLDLDFIARRAWNVEYRPNKFFKGLVMRIREPQTTAVIFKSGKIMCTGAKSVQQARLGARKCARKVQKLGFPVRPLNFKIQTMTAKWKIFPLHLQRISQHQKCSYDPELFPGLIYEVSPGITATIFSSGSICLCGVMKQEAQIYEVFNTIYPILTGFRS